MACPREWSSVYDGIGRRFSPFGLGHSGEYAGRVGLIKMVSADEGLSSDDLCGLAVPQGRLQLLTAR